MSTHFDPFPSSPSEGVPSSPQHTPPNILFAYSDVGNSKRFVSLFHHQIRFAPSWGWMVWDGSRWHRDMTQHSLLLAQRSLFDLHPQMSMIPDAYMRSQFITQMTRSETLPRLKALLACAQCDPAVTASIKDFDADPFLLNVLNGTIDLHTGTLHPHDPAQLLTHLAPIPYNPNTPPGPWHSFLDDITAHDPALQYYLQRVVGSALIGCSNEGLLFLLSGSGRNGKSTWLNALHSVLGDYATCIPAQTFLTRPGRLDLATLATTCLITLTEPNNDSSFNLTRFTSMISGDPVTTYSPSGIPCSFLPRYTLFMVTNHPLTLAEDTSTIWSHIKVLPFPVCFAGREDHTLPETLRTAAPEILAWAVQGCLAWQHYPLSQEEPSSVRAATNAYHRDQDTLSDFLEERCTTGSDKEIAAAELYRDYRDWCTYTHASPLSHIAFGISIPQRGYPRSRTKQGRLYHGLTITTRAVPTMAEILASYEDDDEEPGEYQFPSGYSPL